ncbi:zf-HC2 domain-containing protein [Clostridium bowmanii]|uniref:anti-sigma factor family protein n=1 Tax=Clostridium bowmanii TaxID=132925 RepID=UPI001C0DA5B6|nr:zf-HC2 domain-containing protein [Clostridium bowmanii]MBU3189581.1 zf-HC2 domain-containing protein [Clostridium bowmanii]MCA1073576.1 zf-HC2 domain-containing protein [Clostridium bowmanii]
MIKYPCEMIEDLIPLYIEGDVSVATKEIVEKHLKNCKNCSALLVEYSNDELKVIDFKEDLPHANTFKKLMKKLKIWGLIAVAVAIVVAIAIGTIGYKLGEKPKNDILTLKTIVKTFEKQGVFLKENSSQYLDEYELSGVKPAVFAIGDKKGTLLVYVFKSFVERKDIIEKSNKFNGLFSLQEYPLNAKNALLVYVSAQNPTTEEEMKSIGETRVLISDIVFKYLNDGKVAIYKGESTNWEGTFTVKYYEHWWEDEKGKLHYDSYNESSPLVKYKMTDITSVGPISFEYKTSSGGGTSTGSRLDKEGYSRMGNSGGNGAMHRENEDITFTIKWNGKKENIILKAQK